ncbi:finger 120-like [Octopus vulgaris]|uniref:Finger 120-like n=1 Tax=Octopus vulgaris TaxID=6645 RepID=A0AA36BDN4_OCTVU|nr:finger 120-like [Octopus vulgaris]
MDADLTILPFAKSQIYTLDFNLENYQVLYNRHSSQSEERHIGTHTGEKPYERNTCGKIFSEKYHLTCHKYIHTGEKPYQCNICGRSFSPNSGLTRHRCFYSAETLYRSDLKKQKNLTEELFNNTETFTVNTETIFNFIFIISTTGILGTKVI